MLHYKWGESDFAAGTFLTLNDSTQLDFANAQVILSDFELIRADGTTEKLADTLGARIFKAQLASSHTYTFGNVLSGDFKGLRFHVGLNDSINHVNPVTQMSEQHPLFDAGMHWGWNPAAGYKFVRMEGNAQRRGTESTFTYHLATDNMFSVVNFLENQAFTLDSNNGYTLHLDVDFKAFFNGIDPVATKMVHGNSAAFKTNLPGAFRKAAHHSHD
jgi:hypothetical protein